MYIETSRLKMTQITEDDWDIFKRLHLDPNVMKYVSDPYDDDMLLAKFDSRLPTWSKECSFWLSLVISDKESGEKIGLTGFMPEWKPYQQAELGFMLAPEYQGKGFAKESLFAVLDFAFKTCGFHKLVATVTEGNEQSFGLLKRVGFQHEGTLRENFRLNNIWYNDLKMGLLATEYQDK